MFIISKITEVLRIKNIEQKEMCNYLKIPTSVFSDWKKGRNRSYMKRLPEIANFLGVTVDYLVSGDENNVSESNSEPQIKENLTENNLSEQEKTLIRMFRETTEEGRFEMITAIMNIQKRIRGGGSTGKDSQSAV